MKKMRPRPSRAGEITWFTTRRPDDTRDIELRVPYNLTVMPADERPARGVQELDRHAAASSYS
jgi:hypothetical protein